MDVRLIENVDEFRKLKQPWNELASRTPDDHAFMRHEWFDHWLSSQGVTTQLHMITGWQDGQLVGALPLVWKEMKLRGMCFRALRFAESAVSPRCNALTLSADVLERLLQRLASEKRCQLIELQHLETASPTTRLIVDNLCSRPSLLVAVSPGRQSPYLTLNCGWEDYLRGLPSHRSAWIRKKCINKLHGCGQPFDFRRVKDASEAGYLVDVLLDVSSRSWKADGGSAIPQVPSQKLFYSTFTHTGLAHGLIEAIVLSIGGQAVAFDYYLKCSHRYSLIRGDFDKKYGKFRPGENLRVALIKELAQPGVPVELDFGGTVSDYKLGWSNGMREHLVIHAARRFSKGAWALSWKILKRYVKANGS